MTKLAIYNRGMHDNIIDCSRSTFLRCIPPYIRPMRILRGAVSVACQSCYNFDSQINSVGAFDFVERFIEETGMQLENTFNTKSFFAKSAVKSALQTLRIELEGLHDQHFPGGKSQVKSLQQDRIIKATVMRVSDFDKHGFSDLLIYRLKGCTSTAESSRLRKKCNDHHIPVESVISHKLKVKHALQFNSTNNRKELTTPSADTPIFGVSDQSSKFTLDNVYRNTLRGQSMSFTFYNVVLRFHKATMHSHLSKFIPDLDPVESNPGRTYYEIVYFSFADNKFDTLRVFVFIQYLFKTKILPRNVKINWLADGCTSEIKTTDFFKLTIMKDFMEFGQCKNCAENDDSENDHNDVKRSCGLRLLVDSWCKYFEINCTVFSVGRPAPRERAKKTMTFLTKDQNFICGAPRAHGWARPQNTEFVDFSPKTRIFTVGRPAPTGGRAQKTLVDFGPETRIFSEGRPAHFTMVHSKKAQHKSTRNSYVAAALTLKVLITTTMTALVRTQTMSPTTILLIMT